VKCNQAETIRICKEEGRVGGGEMKTNSPENSTLFLGALEEGCQKLKGRDEKTRVSN